MRTVSSTQRKDGAFLHSLDPLWTRRTQVRCSAEKLTFRRSATSQERTFAPGREPEGERSGSGLSGSTFSARCLGAVYVA